MQQTLKAAEIETRPCCSNSSSSGEQHQQQKEQQQQQMQMQTQMQMQQQAAEGVAGGMGAEEGL